MNYIEEEKYNAALEARYKEWFSAFIANCNENERQGEITDLLLSRLKRQIPNIFTTPSKEPSVFIDLMCGPGDMTRYRKTALQKVGVKDIRAIGIELREDHIDSWKNKLDPEDRVIRYDVSDKGLNLKKVLGPAELQKLAAVFWSHGGYYLYQPRADEEKGSEAELNNQPVLENVVTLIHDILGPNDIAVSAHKSTEWTDILKERFSKFIESHTTKALHHIYDNKGVRYETIIFECILSIPEITPAILETLIVDDIEDYESMKAGQAKTVRQILEFLAHTPLEELGSGLFASLQGAEQTYNQFLKQYPAGAMPITRAQYNGIGSGALSFETFNRQKREEYISYVTALRDRCNGLIPAYIEFFISVSPQAAPDFADRILAVAREINNEAGKKIDQFKFLRVKSEIENQVVCAEQLAMEKAKRTASGGAYL